MHLDAVIWEWIFVVIRIIALFVLTFLIVPYTVMAERWVCAWIQDRIGPNRTGWFGLMQPRADALKLFLKEDIIPNHVHKVYFVIAPTLVFLPALLTGFSLSFARIRGYSPESQTSQHLNQTDSYCPILRQRGAIVFVRYTRH